MAAALLAYALAIALLIARAVFGDVFPADGVQWITTGGVALILTAFFALALRHLRHPATALGTIESTDAEFESRVAARTAELSELARHLLDIREDEKKTIARDLHDEFGSYLTAINMDVSRTRDKLAVSNPAEAAKLNRTLALLNQAIAMKRRLISALRPSILDNLGLGSALEQYIDEWSEHTGISATFDHSGDFDLEEERVPIAVFRVFQEALDNIAVHSGSTAVQAYAHRVDGSLDLEISDNGIGLSAAPRKSGTNGLLGMRERVLGCRGRLEFLRGPTGGTVVRASFPCTARRQQEPVAVKAAVAA